VFEVTQRGDFEEPPEEVFDFVVDLRNERGWHPMLKWVEAKPDGPIGTGIGAGTVFEAEYRRLGKTRADLLEYDRPRHARFDVVTSAADMDMTFRFEPRAGGGTAMSFTAQVEPKRVFKLLGPFGRKMFEREMAKRPHQFRDALAKR
jgi:uncharacterized protein YndB with AHSA1/START domain